MNDSTTNPHEERRRREKVDAITSFLWTRLTPTERRSDRTPRVIENLDASDRARLAIAAGQNPPSDKTWELVVEWVETHVRFAQDEEGR